MPDGRFTPDWRPDIAPPRREALQEFSAKQLRLMMCLQQWGGGMSYGPQSREAMRAREKELKEFFLDMDVAARDVAAAVAAGATVPSSFEARFFPLWQHCDRTNGHVMRRDSIHPLDGVVRPMCVLLQRSWPPSESCVPRHASSNLSACCLKTRPCTQEPERVLRDAILAAEADVDAALRSNIATKDALDALSRLMRATQKYCAERSPPTPGALPLLDLL